MGMGLVMNSKGVKVINAVVIVFSSLKEFKFAEDYLNILVDILVDLYFVMNNFLPEEDSVEKITLPVFDQLERLQFSILKLNTISDYHLENDSISRYSVKIFSRFLSITFKYLENFEKLDQFMLRKIRQSLHEFLIPKNQIYGAELYYFFKAKKLFSLIDSVIDRNINIQEAKINLLKFLFDVDYILLPKRIFISMNSPKLFMGQPFLWQFREKDKVSSLREYIIETEVEIHHIQEAQIINWSVEAELTCSECIFDQIKFTKKAIKTAKPLISFNFLVHFESICQHKLTIEISLLNKNGYLIDKLLREEHIEIIM